MECSTTSAPRRSTARVSPGRRGIEQRRPGAAGLQDQRRRRPDHHPERSRCVQPGDHCQHRDFAQQIRLDVWLRDDSPAGRGEAYKVMAPTVGLRRPDVSVSKGAFCTDGDEDPPNNCWQDRGSGQPPPCDVASCAFISSAPAASYAASRARCQRGGPIMQAGAPTVGPTYSGQSRKTPTGTPRQVPRSRAKAPASSAVWRAAPHRGRRPSHAPLTDLCDRKTT